LPGSTLSPPLWNVVALLDTPRIVAYDRPGRNPATIS